MHTLFKGLLLILLCGTAYVPALSGDYIWDDDAHVSENTTLHDAAGLYTLWTEPTVNQQYYPLTWTSFWIDYQLWGNTPAYSHAVNILWHILNAFLIWYLLALLKVPYPFAVALLFAVHPVHVESVAWISERKNVLSGFFYLAALTAFVKSWHLDKTSNTASPLLFSRRWYGLGLLLFFAALLSKTVTCTLPVILLLLIYWKRPAVHWKDSLRVLPMLLIGAGLGLKTAFLESYHFTAGFNQIDLSLAERCLIAGRALWFYAAKLLWPHPLVFIYPQWSLDTHSVIQWLAPITALGTLALLLQQRKRIGKGLFVAGSCFAVTLFPALGFINVYPFIYTYVADHFQYLASIALLAVFVAGFQKLSAQQNFKAPVRLSALGVVALLLAGMSWKQCHIYENRITLWLDTLSKNPQSWMAHNNLGIEYFEMEDYAAAAQHFQASLQIKPDHHKAHDNLGKALSKLGQSETAEKHFLKALNLFPNDIPTNFNYASFLYQEDRFQDALQPIDAYFKAGLRSADAFHLAGTVMLKLNRTEEALDFLQRALKSDPRDAVLQYRVGVASAQLEDFETARRHLSNALEINPDSAPALNGLGILEASQGHPERALELFTRASGIDPQSEVYRRNYEKTLRYIEALGTPAVD